MTREEHLAQVAAFNKERDEMLLSGDADRLIAFHAKHNPDMPPPTSKNVAEIALHKARTACVSLPIEPRLESKRWLSERGYHSDDDGNLTN